MKRKCPNCGEWNEENDYCNKCNTPISPRIIRQLEDEADRRAQEKKKKTSFDKLQKRLEKSNNPFVIFFSKVLSVIWMIYMGVLSFIIWFIAAVTG